MGRDTTGTAPLSVSCLLSTTYIINIKLKAPPLHLVFIYDEMISFPGALCGERYHRNHTIISDPYASSHWYLCVE